MNLVDAWLLASMPSSQAGWSLRHPIIRRLAKTRPTTHLAVAYLVFSAARKESVRSTVKSHVYLMALALKEPDMPIVTGIAWDDLLVVYTREIARKKYGYA